MNPKTIRKILALGAAGALAFGTAFAQETSTTTVTAGGAGVNTTTSTMDATGTITAYTPGSDYITFRTESNPEPVRYYYTKQTTLVDPEGNRSEEHTSELQSHSFI